MSDRLKRRIDVCRKCSHFHEGNGVLAGSVSCDKDAGILPIYRNSEYFETFRIDRECPMYELLFMREIYEKCVPDT